MKPSDLAKESQAVDVSAPETQHRIQCEEIRLASSALRPLDPEKEKLGDSRFVFQVRVDVHGQQAFGSLETQVVYVTSQPGQPMEGCWLRFSLIGLFTADDQLSPEELGDFARLYTLSILWPYAREYSADQIRRTGEAAPALPIINPQVVTENLIRSEKVEVVIHEVDAEG